MTEKQKAVQEALEKFQRLGGEAQQFIMGFMTCYEQLKK